jgi:hypothetical protein
MMLTTCTNSATAPSVNVATMTSSKPPTFSGKHGDDWTIWEMKMTAHLMDKGLDKYLNPNFENRLPMKEIEFDIDLVFSVGIGWYFLGIFSYRYLRKTWSVISVL